MEVAQGIMGPCQQSRTEPRAEQSPEQNRAQSRTEPRAEQSPEQNRAQSSKRPERTQEEALMIAQEQIRRLTS
ncbi:hypothetical protein E4U21_002759 [Claviceps maximensis]|nr:hypothetical protein E4U21_002759 [Claviceps maximensis]